MVLVGQGFSTARPNSDTAARRRKVDSGIRLRHHVKPWSDASAAELRTATQPKQWDVIEAFLVRCSAVGSKGKALHQSQRNAHFKRPSPTANPSPLPEDDKHNTKC
ncbi:unnamed protein product [Arctogadus glacialis]